MIYNLSLLTPLNRMSAFAADCPHRSVACFTKGVYTASRCLTRSGLRGKTFPNIVSSGSRSPITKVSLV